MNEASHRVLVIDDNPWIHDDVRKVLASHDESPELARLEREMLGTVAAPPDHTEQVRFEIDSALQGREGVEAARRARDDGRPYKIAFVDIRMPPGWDGIQTIEQLWKVDPDVQTVICSAYSDYSWTAIQRRIGGTDRLLVLKKPFEAIEIAQLAHTLARKWSLQHRRAQELVLAGTSAFAHVAGIAGELDDPTQDIGDNLQRLRSAFGATALPAAFDAAFDAVGRIAKIIRATKELYRDDHGERAPVDLNRALLSTLEVARHAYRSVADVETDLGELPPVTCVGSELNLVLLDLIVNAAHAIEATGRRGTIRIRTWAHGDDVRLSVADTGAGIAIGQGLALARSVIVKHGGDLTSELEPGRGTTLTVRLPVAAPLDGPPHT